MSEKLTREFLFNELSKWPGKALDILANTLWARIEADREAIRAETRAEVLNDHYAFGEPLEFRPIPSGSWVRGCLILATNEGFQCSPGWEIRRPSKTRPLTKDEKREFLQGPNGLPDLIERLWNVPEDVLDKYGAMLGMPTETPDK